MRVNSDRKCKSKCWKGQHQPLNFKLRHSISNNHSLPLTPNTFGQIQITKTPRKSAFKREFRLPLVSSFLRTLMNFRWVKISLKKEKMKRVCFSVLKFLLFTPTSSLLLIMMPVNPWLICAHSFCYRITTFWIWIIGRIR